MTLNSMTINSKSISITIAVIAAVVIVCILIVDRPVADFAHVFLRTHSKFFDALTHLVDPIPVIAGLVTVYVGGSSLFGVPPSPRSSQALQIALTILVAIALKEQLKILAGRTWPETWTANNPSYIKDGVYGFFPLQGWAVGGRGYHSFPSGHMTAISAAATSLALALPRLRWLAMLPVTLVAIGMIGCNYHWLSDLIAGTVLGASTALAAHRAANLTPISGSTPKESVPDATLVSGQSTFA